MTNDDCISRQAVIDIIEEVCPIYENDYRYILKDKVNDLPSVTPKPKVDDDYISRQALKDNINSWYDLVNSFGQTNITLSHDDIIKKIDMQTAVKLKPKTGHWVDKHFDIATCSECGFKGGNYHVFNYCPNCGADMRGEV